jgi:hypothetical protein
MKTKCTNKDFEKFVQFCEEYLQKLRLENWEMVFKFDKTPDPPNYANCDISFEKLHARITLFSDWTPDRVTQISLRELAYHEVVHILLAPLMEAHSGLDSIVREHEHNIIKQLCLCSFRPHKYK